MPGAYAHMTLVNALKQPKYAQPAEIPVEALLSAGTFLSYCELGAVSPDYPYLAVGDRDQNGWADAMHYERTGDMIAAGIRHVRTLQGAARQKVYAWLLGYAAHVATDVTIHPVIELKVGEYANPANRRNHRICEMNQDVYVFRRFGVGHLEETRYLASGIGACTDPSDHERLDPDIRTAWTAMLSQVHPEKMRTTPPNLDEWHARFNLMIGSLATSGRHFVKFARHMLEDQGLTYPETPDPTYILQLATPGGGMRSYDEVFELAIRNVGEVWADIGRAIAAPAQSEFVATVRNWNLDTGKDESGKIGFWGVA